MHNILLYIWLAESFPYGSIKPVKIVNEYGDNIEKFYNNIDKEAKKFNITEKRLKSLKSRTVSDFLKIIKNCEKLNIKISCYNDKNYPKKLENFEAAPIVLYYVGDLSVLNRPTVAIVGTRKATAYGLSVAKRLAKDLAEYGITVVSGCAEGIDTEAHCGALEGFGATAAVLGTSLEKNYPDGSGKLKREIVKKGGVVLSEYAPNTEIATWLFPIRNRIIVGLADSVIVAQSPEKSGAMITANIACENGKELFCVPPEDIYSEKNYGVKKCLKEGANLLLDLDDILETYKFSNYVISKKIKLADDRASKRSEQNVPENLKPVLHAITTSENLEQISEKSNIPTEKLLPMLTELEILGFVKKFGLFYKNCC